MRDEISPIDPDDEQDILDDQLICESCGDPCDEVDEDGWGPCCGGYGWSER